MKSLFALTAVVGLAGGLAAISVPAEAQDSGGKVMEVLVFGKDPCPRSTESEVVVCRRLDERERYRIPERLRSGGPRQPGQAWAAKTRSLETVGNTGIQSCSPVGPAGYTGCLQQLIKQSRQEAKEAAQEGTAPAQ